MNAPRRHNYLFGIILSFLLAGWLALLGLAAVTNSNLGWGIVALVTGAVTIGGPLAVLLLITWVVYMVREQGQVPGRVHALLILPPLLSALIVPISMSIEKNEGDRFSEAHPPIAETHVNLSGKDLGLDTSPYASTSSGGGPMMPFSATQPDRFMAFRRYPDPDSVATNAFPYEDARLRDTVDQYTYRSMSGEAGASLPLIRLSYPDLKQLPPVLRDHKGEMLVHLYFHYPDHVDVAPSLGILSGSEGLTLETRKISGLLLFHIYNYSPSTIVRLEVDGQTLDLGERAIHSEPPLPARCNSFSRPLGGALINPGQSLAVRWQTVEQPQAWHTAAVHLPDSPSSDSTDEQKGAPRVLFYFLPDGNVVAERYVEFRLFADQLAIRATGLPPEAKPFAACGSAYSAYNPQTVKLLAN